MQNPLTAGYAARGTSETLWSPGEKSPTEFDPSRLVLGLIAPPGLLPATEYP